jgi:hypothetical protein
VADTALWSQIQQALKLSIMLDLIYLSLLFVTLFGAKISQHTYSTKQPFFRRIKNTPHPYIIVKFQSSTSYISYSH